MGTPHWEILQEYYQCRCGMSHGLREMCPFGGQMPDELIFEPIDGQTPDWEILQEPQCRCMDHGLREMLEDRTRGGMSHLDTKCPIHRRLLTMERLLCEIELS